MPPRSDPRRLHAVPQATRTPPRKPWSSEKETEDPFIAVLRAAARTPLTGNYPARQPCTCVQGVKGCPACNAWVNRHEVLLMDGTRMARTAWFQLFEVKRPAEEGR